MYSTNASPCSDAGDIASLACYPSARLTLANGPLFITFALIIWSFRVIFERPGAQIDLDGYTDTLTSRPFPFEAGSVPCMDEKC